MKINNNQSTKKNNMRINNKKLNFILIAIGLTFMNCTENNQPQINDMSPEILIISPIPNQEYVAEWGGAWPKGEPVTLEANGTDDIEINTIIIVVTNSNGDVVFEKTTDNTSNNKTAFTVSEKYIAQDPDTYTVVYTAIDSNGNKATSISRSFIYN